MLGAVIEKPLTVIVATLCLVNRCGVYELVVGAVKPQHRNGKMIEVVGDLMLSILVPGERGVADGYRLNPVTRGCLDDREAPTDFGPNQANVARNVPYNIIRNDEFV